MGSEVGPILYSFRRCPYAMRARLGLASAGIACELREVILRDKPVELLEASAKGTVPVLVLADGRVIDESLDIMKWALGEQDPEGLFTLSDEQYVLVDDLIERNDTVFKAALDRYKYPWRYELTDEEARVNRDRGAEILWDLDVRLRDKTWLLGDYPTLADMALLPFVRQYSIVDQAWFAAVGWSGLQRWLADFLESERFLSIMTKYPQWKPGAEPTVFMGQ